MKMLKKLKFAGVAFGLGILLINSASASFLIEPHLAYNLSGSGDGTYAGVKNEFDYNGAQYGLRAGYDVLGLMAGLDYTHSSFDLEKKVGGVKTTSSSDRNEIGVFAGYNLPILLRVWGAYYFTNTIKASGSYELSGNTKELGVGFTGLPFLSINLMYRIASYDEQKLSGVTSAVNPTLNINEIVLGVSLPLNL